MFKEAFFKVTILTKMANMVTLASNENFNYNSKGGCGGGGGGGSKRRDLAKKVKRKLLLLVPLKSSLRASSPGRSSGGTRKGRRACN